STRRRQWRVAARSSSSNPPAGSKISPDAVPSAEIVLSATSLRFGSRASVGVRESDMASRTLNGNRRLRNELHAPPCRYHGRDHFSPCEGAKPQWPETTN